MKMKKNVSGFLLIVLFTFVFGIFASINVKAAEETEVTGVLSTNIAGGWGQGIAVEFTPSLGTGTYWEAIETANLELRDSKGVIVPIATAETVDAQIAINRGLGYSYYGYTLTIKAGFQAVRKSDAVALGLVVATEKTFVFTGSVSAGGYWEAYVAPTSLSVDDNTLDLQVGGSTHQIVVTSLPETTNAVIVYESANSAVASVSNTGLIEPLTEGNTSVTVYMGTFSQEITVAVAAASLAQTDILVTNTDKTITTYQGYDYDLSELTAVIVYDGGSTGAAIEITSAMISGIFDKDVVGDYTLTLTDGEFSDTFTVSVVALPAIEPKGNVSGVDFGNNSGWGSAFYMVFNSPDISMYLNIKDEALDQIKAHVSFAGSKTALLNVKNLGGGRYEFYIDSAVTLKAGDKVVLEAGLGLWQYEGGTINGNHDASGGEFVVIGELKQDYTYVFTGTTWVQHTQDPTDFTLTSETPFVAIGATLELNYTVSPEGTYGTPVFESSNPLVATVSELGVVSGITEGTVEITATIGTIEKTIEVTVTQALDITGVELLDVYNIYYVLKDSTSFAPVFTSARLVFVGGSKSPAFNITEADYEVEAIDTSSTGELTASIVITYDNVEYETSIPVMVYSYLDQQVSEVAIVDWFIYATFIQLPNTSANVGNITNASLMPETLDYLTYTREDGTVIDMTGFYMLGTNLVIFPEFLYDETSSPVLNLENYNQYYLVGDMITLDAGMPIYRWTGGLAPTETDNNALDLGTGEVVIDGLIPETIKYRYNGSIWSIYIPYTDISSESTSLAIEIGENVVTGVSRFPANATTGTFTYSSSNNSVATVTSNGIINGVAAGTAHITVTLTDQSRPDDTKTVIITVTVSDYIEKIVFSGDVEVVQGKELDLSKLDAKFQWKSGTLGDSVDLTNATASGFDFDTLGEQTGVVSVTVGDVTYTGQLTLTVIKSNVVGTVAIISGITLAIGGGLSLAWFFLIKKRKI